MTPEMWNTILSAVLFVIIGAVGWLAKSVIGTAREVAAIKASLDLDKIDDDLSSVHKRVTTVSRDVSRLSGQLKVIESQTAMINQHLLDKDGR